MDVQGISLQTVTSGVPSSFARTPQPETVSEPERRETSHSQAVEEALTAGSATESRIDLDRAIRLHVDEPTGRIVAEILDENNEVVRQIPPEEILQLARFLRELTGILFDRTA